MRYTPNNAKTLLDYIPDFTSWEEAARWLKDEIHIIRQSPTESLLAAEFTSLDWEAINGKENSPFGLYASERWRKFVLAVFIADLISYAHPADRVNFERLLFVMHTYPQGFRTWWIKLPDRRWLPVGYTAWYPMHEATFKQLKMHPETLKDRLVVPCQYSKSSTPYLYLFNYSAAPAFKGSVLTKELMRDFVEDIEGQKAAGMACIAVSNEGVRIAERFGMDLSGYLYHEGNKEGIYTVLYNSSQSNA